MATIAPTAPTPQGIDPALVIDFNYYNDKRYERAGGIHEAIIGLREKAPDVFWSTELGGYWVIQGYESIVDAAARTDLFTSSNMALPPREVRASEEKFLPLNMDPPNHAQFRAPLNQAFTPSQMHKRIDQIRELAVDLIEAIVPRGEADFFAEVTEKLPVLIFIDLMGLDRADFKPYRALAKAAVASSDTVVRSEALMDAVRLLSAQIAKRRAAPCDDLISRLLELEIDGQPVTDAQLLGYCKLLFFAGLDTVANAMTFAMRYLATDQALQQRLRDEPEKIPHAMEELLRRHGVAPVVRQVTKDEAWRGFNLRAGDMVLLNYPGANIDERVFDHAQEVDIDRERINHIVFGSGVHRCVGRHLARIEMVVLLEEVMRRLPTFRITPGARISMTGGSVLSIDALPLVWDAA